MSNTEVNQTSAPKNVIKSISVAGSRIVDNVVNYVIRVATDNKVWCTVKRYKAFEELHSILLTIVPDNRLPSGCALPAKRSKFWLSYDNYAFIEARALLLQLYLTYVLSLTDGTAHELLRGFLVSDSLSIDIPSPQSLDVIIQNIQFSPRSPITNITVIGSEMIDDLPQRYCIHLVNDHTNTSWTTLRSINEFIQLEYDIHDTFGNRPTITSELPRLSELLETTAYEDRHSIEHRRFSLQYYLQRILCIEPILYTSCFLDFIDFETQIHDDLPADTGEITILSSPIITPIPLLSQQSSGINE